MAVDLHQAHFLLGAAHPDQFPENSQAEVAFCGRSNCGKSSIINTLTGQKRLARTSKTPGRTQELNFFQLAELPRYLVDLPGYGFARVTPKQRQRWAQLIEGYFQNRDPLRGLVLIMDIRHPMKDTDLQLIDFCQHNDLPCHLVANKADKLSRQQARRQTTLIQNWMHSNLPEPWPSLQAFSCLKRHGMEALHDRLATWLQP